jgi:hypothetical protein
LYNSLILIFIVGNQQIISTTGKTKIAVQAHYLAISDKWEQECKRVEGGFLWDVEGKRCISLQV